jgi:hypothetical protein
LRGQFAFREPLWPGKNETAEVAPAGAITATPTAATQTDRLEFRVHESNHDEMVTTLTRIIQYQQAHPELYYYTRSRTFFRSDPSDATKEIWMTIVESDNQGVCAQSQLDAAASDAQAASNQVAFQALLTTPPPSHYTWTEETNMRVQYAFREPLWPGCA